MMSDNNKHTIDDSHWLNWCRLCAKDDVCGNVRVYTSENAKTWNSLLVMAIRKYFDVQMRLEDELSGVLCKECYTLISEMIDFAEHVNKVQAMFEVLRCADPNVYLDVDSVREQYGLTDGDWTHIIKPVLEIDYNAGKQVDALDVNVVPKLEIVELAPDIEIKLVDPKNNTQANTTKRRRGRPRKVQSNTNATDKPPLPQVQKIENFDSDDDKPILVKIKEDMANDKFDADLELLPEIASPSNYSDGNCENLSDSDEEDEDGSKGDEDLKTSRKRKKLECKWCAKVYLNPASYQKHLTKGCRKIEKRKTFDKDTYCKLCDKTFSTAGALKLHDEGMHKNAKPFICDHCGRQVKTLTALKEHLLVHTEERPFACPVCKAGFKNKARLRVHKQTHDEPSYICNICGKKLQTRRTWNMHKMVHSEDRKFKCDACGAMFKRSKTLKKHLISHTGLRPYLCTFCKRTFACSSNCRGHMIRKHSHEFQKDNGPGMPDRLRVPTLEELQVMSQKHHM